MHNVTVEPHNLLWAHLPGNLASLQVRDETGRLYCLLMAPSDELARAALWESVSVYASEWAGTGRLAPSLEIQAVPRG